MVINILNILINYFSLSNIESGNSIDLNRISLNSENSRRTLNPIVEDLPEEKNDQINNRFSSAIVTRVKKQSNQNQNHDQNIFPLTTKPLSVNVIRINQN